MKILIVEDESSLQELMQLYLADYGTCDTADNGAEALETVERAIAADQPYDLICMDIMMPEMDGMEALQKIRRMEFRNTEESLPSVKVIMITAKDMAKDMMSAYNAGCEAYITKPFSREKLLEQIRELGLFDAAQTNCQ
ncbi:MAG: response regulator transcription factor [Phycisphaerae bacterium]|nr:response regulator transcription factor [Phycisphaerae bacterium]